MQRPHFSSRSVLEALDLDTACLSLLEQTPEYQQLINSDTPEAIYTAIRTIGNILNVHPSADQLAEDLEERLNIIIHKLKFITEENKPKITFLDGISPLTTIYNSYLANLTRLAGGILQPEITGEYNPDILLIFNEEPMVQLLAELPQTLASSWSQTRAAAENRIYIIHHTGYLRQPGAWIADDAEILAEILYPNYFVFGRDTDVWMRFEWQ